MTVYLRLFAGFTSFISNLAVSQARSIGPEGDLDSSGILGNDPGHHRDGDGCESTKQEKRESSSNASESRRIAGMIHTDGLEHTPDAMIEVCAQQSHGDDVGNGNGDDAESGDYIVVRLEVSKVRMHRAPGEMELVID